jgi:putative spermidine/putrescine transport system permease protein
MERRPAEERVAAALLLIIGTLDLGGNAAALRWCQERIALQAAP